MFYNYNYVYAAPLQPRANPIDKTTFNTTATNLTHSLFLIGQKIWLQEQFPAHGVCITMLIYADAHANVRVCSYPQLLYSLFQDSIQTVLVWGEQYMVGVWWFLTWSFKDKKKKKPLWGVKRTHGLLGLLKKNQGRNLGKQQNLEYSRWNLLSMHPLLFKTKERHIIQLAKAVSGRQLWSLWAVLASWTWLSMSPFFAIRCLH